MKFQDGSHLVFQSGTNFESNLAQMVPYHPVKLQIDGEKCLSVSQETEFQDGSYLVFPNGTNF